MKPLSVAADMAWRIAAHEAAGSGYRYLEKEHLFIGILSIEKALADGPEQAEIEQAAWNNLKAEYSALRKALRSQGIDQTKLRRILRRKLGNGGYKHTEDTIHRSEGCKALFVTAADNSASKLITTLHLAAAITENPGDILAAILSDLGVGPKAFRDALLTPTEEAPVQADEGQNNNAPQSYLDLRVPYSPFRNQSSSHPGRVIFREIDFID